MRKLALFLVLAVLLSVVPVHAAPLRAPGYEYTDRDVMDYQIINPRTQAVINNLYTTDQLRQKLGRELQEVQVAEVAPAMVSDAWASYQSTVNTQGQARSYLYQNISDTELLAKGCAEFFNVAMEGISQGAHNLNDPQKRYEYWKSRGIYDKFTPRQIEYINKVCMPLMSIGASIAGTVSATFAAGCIAALTGVSFPILAAAGMAAFMGLTAVKFTQMKKGADVAIFGKEPMGLSKYTGGLVLGQAAQVGLAGHLASGAGGVEAGLAAGSLSSLLPMIGAGGGFLVGSAGVIGGSVGLLSILNAGPIPQDGEGEGKPTNSFSSGDWTNPDPVLSPKEFRIDYRLTQ